VVVVGVVVVVVAAVGVVVEAAGTSDVDVLFCKGTLVVDVVDDKEVGWSKPTPLISAISNTMSCSSQSFCFLRRTR